jgi:hypothetical protein
MNIVIDISNVYLNGIFIFDKRKNVIIDGYFSRLVYSTSHFVMNGLYIKCQLYKAPENIHSGLIRHSNSYPHLPTSNSYSQLSTFSLSDFSPDTFRSNESFDLKNPHNLTQVTTLSSIEEYILQQYKDTKTPNKVCVYNLRNQLYGGCLKINGNPTKNDSIKFILKISGIWETDTSIGITFKLQLY